MGGPFKKIFGCGNMNANMVIMMDVLLSQKVQSCKISLSYMFYCLWADVLEKFSKFIIGKYGQQFWKKRFVMDIFCLIRKTNCFFKTVFVC